MICLNRRCRQVIGDHYWGAGYCCERCYFQSASNVEGETRADRLCDPTDPTGRTLITRTRDETDAMLEAAEIDGRLPKIIYLRKRGLTIRKLAPQCGCDESTCRRLLKRAAPNLLRACGLR